MDKTDILIFDVGLGQSIFVYPHSQPEYGMLIDCGNTPEFDPINYLIDRRYISNGVLKNLTLTNYDQDHFSGFPNLREKVFIETINFAKNLTSSEIKDLKEKPLTEAVKKVCDIKDEYVHSPVNYNPPYAIQPFHLQKEHLDKVDTNNLSQVIFIEHYDTVVCVSGDLEEKGWQTLLQANPVIKDWLKRTNIFIASHHGRENGYCPDVFSHCKPECIIISDKGIIHDTQKNMSAVYGTHVSTNGIKLGVNSSEPRKVLTTRDDGHIYIQLMTGGTRLYNTFKHE